MVLEENPLAWALVFECFPRAQATARSSTRAPQASASSRATLTPWPPMCDSSRACSHPGLGVWCRACVRRGLQCDQVPHRHHDRGSARAPRPQDQELRVALQGGTPRPLKLPSRPAVAKRGNWGLSCLDTPSRNQIPWNHFGDRRCETGFIDTRQG
jgi:hypothetical protein